MPKNKNEKKLSRKERKELARELSEKKKMLKEEMENLEHVAVLNDDMSFDYKAAEKRSSVSALRYTAMYEDGICEICPNLFSITLEFDNLMYQIAGEEEQERIFQKYCQLLNSLPYSSAAQLTTRNYFREDDEFLDSILMPTGGRLDAYAKEMNQMIREKSKQGDNSLVTTNYLTLTYAASDSMDAIAAGATLYGEIRKQFTSLKCGCRQLSGIERTKLLHSYFYPVTFSFCYDDLLSTGLTTKHYVAPESFDFSPSYYYSFDADGQTKYGQTIILKQLPPHLADNLIATLADTKCDMTFNAFIRPVKHETAMSLVKNQRAKMDMQSTRIQEQNLQRINHPGLPPFELRFSMEQADDLIEDLQKRNQRLFRVTVMIHTTADSLEELETNVYKLNTASRKCNCEFANLPEQQEPALNSIIPIGAKYIDVERNLTTAATAVFIPFTVQEIQNKGGIYHGQNAITKNLIAIDRTELKNGNAVICGVSGGGKSFYGKGVIAQLLIRYPKDEVLIIDPEAEFVELAKRMGGEVLEISASSSTHLNMFDMAKSYNDDDNPLLLKGEFILSVFEIIFGNMNPVARSVIDKCMRAVYEPFFASGMSQNRTPTLKDLNDMLKKQDFPDARLLAESIDLYTEGSLSAFSHRTNVNISDTNLVVIDTFKLGSQLKTLGMMIVMDHIWNRVIDNRKRGVRTWIFTDEMQEFFNTESGSNYFATLWARIRKRNANMTGLLQNVDRMLNNERAKYILANSEMVVMLDQGKGDRDALVDLLGISPEQEDYITNANVGEGLLRAGDNILPFVNLYPTDTELYRIMTTKPSDFAAS
jgi:archaellum component FlaC